MRLQERFVKLQISNFFIYTPHRSENYFEEEAPSSHIYRCIAWVESQASLCNHLPRCSFSEVASWSLSTHYLRSKCKHNWKSQRWHWFLPRNSKGPGQRALLIIPKFKKKRHVAYKMLKKTDCQNKETHFVEFMSVVLFCFVTNMAIYFTKGALLSFSLGAAGSYTNRSRFQPYRIIPCLYSTAGRRATVCLYSDRSWFTPQRTIVCLYTTAGRAKFCLDCGGLAIFFLSRWTLRFVFWGKIQKQPMRKLYYKEGLIKLKIMANLE